MLFCTEALRSHLMNRLFRTNLKTSGKKLCNNIPPKTNTHLSIRVPTHFLIQVMFSSFSDFSSLFLLGSGMIGSGKEGCVWQVGARSDSPTHLRTEQRNKIGGILPNAIRVMDGCHLSLGFSKYRNSIKTETCQTRGFGKNLNWTE